MAQATSPSRGQVSKLVPVAPLTVRLYMREAHLLQELEPVRKLPFWHLQELGCADGALSTDLIDLSTSRRICVRLQSPCMPH